MKSKHIVRLTCHAMSSMILFYVLNLFFGFPKERQCSNTPTAIEISERGSSDDFALPDTNIFDCDAYQRGEIEEPAEMKEMRNSLVEFKAMSRPKNKQTFMAKPSLVAAYRKAELEVKRRGYRLAIGTAFRSFEKQADLYCAKSQRADGVPPDVAQPGESSHGFGTAIDVFLFRGKNRLTYAIDHDKTTDNEKILHSIMESAGFVSSNEFWHFELRTPAN